MDRLTWYIHSADEQCLNQAVEVARRHPIDLERIEAWATKERPEGAERFRVFAGRLQALRPSGR